MTQGPVIPEGHSSDVPEVMPQLIPVPEIQKKEITPIEVINGAYDELRRKENDEGGDLGEVPRPTIH